MSGWLNGHKSVIGWATALAAFCSIGSSAVTAMVVWDKKVDAGVVQREMVNRHNATLQEIVPQVQADAMANARQDVALNYVGETNTRQERMLEQLTEKLSRLADLVLLDIQAKQKRGEIAR